MTMRTRGSERARRSAKLNDKSASPIEDPRLFEDVAEIDVSVEEIRIQGDRFFEVMYGQPYFALGIEDATEVAPGDCEVRSCLDGLQIASLEF